MLQKTLLSRPEAEAEAGGEEEEEIREDSSGHEEEESEGESDFVRIDPIPASNNEEEEEDDEKGVGAALISKQEEGTVERRKKSEKSQDEDDEEEGSQSNQDGGPSASITIASSKESETLPRMTVVVLMFVVSISSFAVCYVLWWGRVAYLQDQVHELKFKNLNLQAAYENLEMDTKIVKNALQTVVRRQEKEKWYLHQETSLKEILTESLDLSILQNNLTRDIASLIMDLKQISITNESSSSSTTEGREDDEDDYKNCEPPEYYDAFLWHLIRLKDLILRLWDRETVSQPDCDALLCRLSDFILEVIPQTISKLGSQSLSMSTNVLNRMYGYYQQHQPQWKENYQTVTGEFTKVASLGKEKLVGLGEKISEHVRDFDFGKEFDRIFG